MKNYLTKLSLLVMTLFVIGGIAHTRTINQNLNVSGNIVSPTITGPTITGTVSGSATYSTPTLTTPTVASFTNATHNHQSNAGGGQLDAAAIAAGTLPVARGGTGVTSSTGSTNVVLSNSPTIVTPTIASFTNAQHNHTNGAGGGQLSITGATTGTLTVDRGGTSTTTSTGSGSVVLSNGATMGATTFNQGVAVAGIDLSGTTDAYMRMTGSTSDYWLGSISSTSPDSFVIYDNNTGLNNVKIDANHIEYMTPSAESTSSNNAKGQGMFNLTTTDTSDHTVFSFPMGANRNALVITHVASIRSGQVGESAVLTSSIKSTGFADESFFSTNQGSGSLADVSASAAGGVASVTVRAENAASTSFSGWIDYMVTDSKP